MYFSLPRVLPLLEVSRSVMFNIGVINGLGGGRIGAVQFVLLSPHVFLRYHIKRVGQYSTITSICVFINNRAAKGINRSFGFMIEGVRV